MSGPHLNGLQRAVARLDWAHRHIENLNCVIDKFITDERPYEVVRHCESVKGKQGRVGLVFTLRVRKEIPPDVSFFASDAIHQLRATVDNLLWELGQRKGCTDNLSLKYHRNTTKADGTVVKSWLDHFGKWRKDNRVDLLPPEIQTWIKNEQIDGRSERMPSPLGAANALWSKDKHRSPILTAIAAPVIVGFRLRPDQEFFGQGPALEDGAVIARALVPHPAVDDFNPKFTFGVRFKDGGRYTYAHRTVGEQLTDTEEYIRRYVLPLFEPHLT